MELAIISVERTTGHDNGGSLLYPNDTEEYKTKNGIPKSTNSLGD